MLASWSRRRSLLGPIVMRLRMSASLQLDRPLRSRGNVVADLKGWDKPDEIVLIGAHLDSWYATIRSPHKLCFNIYFLF
jgi:hypothetical protein